MSDIPLIQRIEQVGQEQKVMPTGIQTPYAVKTVETILDLAEHTTAAGAGMNPREMAQFKKRMEMEIMEVAQDGYLAQARAFAYRYNDVMDRLRSLQR